MTETVLTIAEAATALGVSTKTVRRLVDARKIGHIRLTPRGKIQIAQAELDRYQESCTVGPRPTKPQPSLQLRRLSSESIPRSEWGGK